MLNNEPRVSREQQQEEEEENANGTNMIDMVFKIKSKISQMYNEMSNFIFMVSSCVLRQKLVYTFVLEIMYSINTYT